MLNTKLIKLLKTFSKADIIRFKDFVSSPYYNKNIKVIKLSEIVSENHPDFNSKNFTEELIFKEIFGKEVYNYFKIKNIVSDLYQLALEYLKVTATERNETSNDIHLLNELHERKLDNIYKQKEKLINENLSAIMVKDEFYYLNQYQLARVNTSHYKFVKTGYTFDLIQNEFDLFLKYSLIGLLRHYAKLLTNKNHGNIQFKLEMFDDVWNYIKDKEFENEPSCRIYKEIIALELSKDEKDYKNLMESKDKYKDNLSDEDMYYILLVKVSFAVYRLKLGDESYYKDRFSALKEIQERNFTPDNNFLFVNFISTYVSACMVNEYDWANSFMKKYQNSISPGDEIANSINYCKGFLAYRLKEYDKAIEYFSKTNFKIFLMKIMIKSYTIRIYYEQDLYEQTFFAIDSFRHYLKSEKLIREDQKTANYEFLTFVNELTKLKLETSKKKINSDLMILKKQIKEMSSNPLGAKNWLINKCENFKLK